jgi:hypothetical protein
MRDDHLVNMAARRAHEKAQGGISVANRNGKLALNAMTPAIPTPRLANPTSAWKGLFSQPMNFAAMSPKKTWNTKLMRLFYAYSESR